MITRREQGSDSLRSVTDKVKALGTDLDTLLCLKQTTNKDLLGSTGNSAQYSLIT